MMLALSLLFAVGFAVGCGGGNSSDGAAGSSTGDTEASSATTEPNASTGEARTTPETTGGVTTTPSPAGYVQIERLSSGTQGPEKRQILIATSARDLAAGTGLDVPDSGEGTYVAVAWGEKPTGGYTVNLRSAAVDGVRVRVNVELKDPPPDAMVAQALTYPYAVAVLRDIDLGEKKLVFVTRNGRELDWPVRNV